MAATDQAYRNQKALDIVFAVSTVLMLLSIVWMFAEDYNREFKAEQRQFRDVQAALAQRQALEQLPSRKEFEKARRELEAAKKARADNKETIDDLRRQASAKQPAREKLDARYQDIKAELDSRRSFYDLAVDRYGAQSPQARQYGQEVVELNKRLEETQSQRDELADEIKALRARADAYDQPVTKAEGQLNKITERFDAQVKLAIQKEWRLGDWVRNLPVLDAFASPIKIQQVTLDTLPIDYNFKRVTRFDRCMTCHQGIDKNGYTKEALRALTRVTPAQQKRLDEAHVILEERRAALEGLPALKNAPNPDELRLTLLSEDYLTPSRVNEFCAHPRLDLYVGSGSKHPAEKFGCTICHGGQGSATSFTLASHTPNGPEQQEQWQHHHDWSANHYWDFPMLPMRFVESSCLRCHHQVTDVISADNQNNAPKLLRGYNLLRENGCFGCHEIAGRSKGREVGPDIRLEANPPLEDLTPAERTRLLADPETAPGNMRKVGPSLYRIVEKSNEDWAAHWLRAPRAFRPDTKMPHFYGLVNNHPSKLSDELDGPSQLADEQKKFPDAEIRSIAYYLFRASQDYLKDVEQRRKDDAGVRRADEELVSRLKAKAQPSKEEKQQLDEATTRIRRRKAPGPIAELPLSKDYDAKGAVARGRTLFSERGCLACHSHQATDKEGDGAPALPSEAQFGPNLSQLKAKLGNGKADKRARTWLMNWVKDPHVHSPRSRMPVTHLTNDQAADVAAWLLSQEPAELGAGWAKLQVPEPDRKTLVSLVNVYLNRVLAPFELEKFHAGKLPAERVADLGQEERDLVGRLKDRAGGAEAMKFYLGKKAVTRLGCFGCHDIPGFDTAKPIGVGLQDWGKKDPSKLAFEDSDHFVADNFHIVTHLAEKGKAVGVKVEDGKRKPPYERFYDDLLKHRQREGYLNLKVRDPRSFDYNRIRNEENQRIRAWDDLSRMPQFKFARSRRRAKEGGKDYEARLLKEEDEAREAVMTFILGLVAEPVPMQHVSQPAGDRLAEVRGRQILEKYNCAGCHLVRPGVFEFKVTPKTLSELVAAQRANESVDKSDFDFLSHHYWAGTTPAANADTLRAYGVKPILDTKPGKAKEKVLYLNLTEALRYRDDKGKLQDLRASSAVAIRPDDLVYPPARDLVPVPGGTAGEAQLAQVANEQGHYGGTFARLLGEYLMEKDPKEFTRPEGYPLQENNAVRASVPPSLIGEGERTQPDWLFRFLLNPEPVRKMTVLRMPRFNMSDEEARALVAYFAGVQRLMNPGQELTFPHVTIPQQQGSLDDAYWKGQTAAYISRLKATRVKGPDGKDVSLFDRRIEELRPTWQNLRQEAEQRAHAAEAEVKAAKTRADAARAAAKKADEAAKGAAQEKEKKAAEDRALEAERVLAAWEGERNQLQARAKAATLEEQQAQWEQQDAYVTDAFRLLTDRNLCSKCHQIGNLAPGEGKTQGPPLGLAATRLRPDWVKRWVANPQRHLPWPSVMPQYFPSDEPAKFQELFPGTPLDRIMAVRDVLMIYSQAQEMPLNRQWLLPALAEGPPAGETKSKGDKSGKSKKGAGK